MLNKFKLTKVELYALARVFKIGRKVYNTWFFTTKDINKLKKLLDMQL